jgi:tRNA-splicing ligase RtcB
MVNSGKTFVHYNGIPVWGEADTETIRQMEIVAKTADFTALMADHHIGYSVPIGGVAVYRDAISPSGVGFDIACGNKAVRLDIPASEIKPRIREVMDLIWQNLNFGIGMNNATRVDHELFDDPAWKIPAVKPLRQKAQNQLGTIGSGNHYVDLFEDENGQAWIGVHFGSRGLGHGIATHFIKAGGGKDGMFVEPVVLAANSDLGEQYIKAMELAGRYAYAGRDWVCAKVAALLGAKIEEEVHNHHNFAWREKHRGAWYWVVRKGATPAFPGQKGFVGGSMGDISVILEGVESNESEQAFYSTVHGAGRVISRTKAAGKVVWKNGKPHRVSSGEISRKMMMQWIHQQGVELRGAGTDEAPQCYKRLPEVLQFHRNTLKILHLLRPLGVAMAGENEFDPYKD